MTDSEWRRYVAYFSEVARLHSMAEEQRAFCRFMRALGFSVWQDGRFHFEVTE